MNISMRNFVLGVSVCGMMLAGISFGGESDSVKKARAEYARLLKIKQEIKKRHKEVEKLELKHKEKDAALENYKTVKKRNAKIIAELKKQTK